MSAPPFPTSDAVSVAALQRRIILNSHGGRTTEFTVRLANGRIGWAAAPQGETTSVFEREAEAAVSAGNQAALREAVLRLGPVDQPAWDAFILERIPTIGRASAYPLSLAFFNAVTNHGGAYRREPGDAPVPLPRLCLNIINGGQHAYTNPVLSDFPEYLLIPRHDDFVGSLADHTRLQEAVKARLAGLPKRVINGNRVSVPGCGTNEDCLGLLVEILDALSLRDRYGIMLDASAGDLWRDGRYTFPVTGRPALDSAGLTEYWSMLMRRYPLDVLEDPFHEGDMESWQRLTAEMGEWAHVISDNLYCSDPDRIARGARAKQTTGTIVKPNQSGTVSRFLEAVETAKRHGQVLIASHRSISTESLFLATATVLKGIPMIKIGPLLTDYSSILRLNELLRVAGRDLA